MHLKSDNNQQDTHRSFFYNSIFRKNNEYNTLIIKVLILTFDYIYFYIV